MKRLLLYLDILGFTAMARSDRRVRQVYRLIDSSRVHTDSNFRSIVFSDTLLVYSEREIPEQHFPTEVMFLCEYAQQLLHIMTRNDVYFRAFITYGKFTREKMTHLDAFWGPALVSAYQREKEIKCVGLFIDDYCNRYNKIFRTRRYKRDVSFVYLTLNSDRTFRDWGLTSFPIPGEILEATTTEYLLVWEIFHFEDVHRQMLKHAGPDVRAKFLTAWSYYLQQYPDLLSALVASKFQLSAVASLDWSKAIKVFEQDRKYFLRAKTPKVSDGPIVK